MWEQKCNKYCFQSFHRKRCNNKLFKSLDSIKTILSDHGLLLTPHDEKHDVMISLDKTKIDKDSPVHKTGTTGFYLSIDISHDYFKLSLNVENSKVKVIECSSCFPIKEILKLLSKQLNITLYDKYEDELSIENSEDIDTIINNLKDHKDFELYKEKLIKLTKYKTKVDKYRKWKIVTDDLVDEYNKKFSELNTEKMKLSENFTELNFKENDFFKTLSSIKHKANNMLEFYSNKENTSIHDEDTIKNKVESFNTALEAADNILNKNPEYDRLNEISLEKETLSKYFEGVQYKIDRIIDKNNSMETEFIEEMIDFEKTLFPGIFEFKTEPTDTNIHLDSYIKKYVQIANEIRVYFVNMERFYTLQNNIDNYSSYIIPNNNYELY